MSTVNVYGDNPFQPGMVADTYKPDQLIAGDLKLVTQPIILVAGAGALPRGTVLGRVSTQNLISVTGNNTGNGTIGSLAASAGVKLGAYQLKATNAATFSVTDPEGNALPNATVGTPYANSGVAFTITAGGTAFAANDTFTLAVDDAVGQYRKSVASANDGSQNPSVILVDYVDASTTAKEAGAYVMGEFNWHSLVVDASWTLATLRGAMASGIFIKSSQSAADPS